VPDAARQKIPNAATDFVFAAIGTPYTIKFLWAPLVDALDVPMLSAWLGRRRGWLLFSQVLLMAAIALLALCDPAAAPAQLQTVPGDGAGAGGPGGGGPAA